MNLEKNILQIEFLIIKSRFPKLLKKQTVSEKVILVLNK